MRSTTPIRFFLLLSSAALLSACTSAPLEKPDEALSTAEYAVMQANRAVGEETQSVPLYEAEKKLGQARALMGKPNASEEDYTQARRLAEEATLDARLALARANTQRAQKQQGELEKTIETLHKEIQREETE